MFSTALVSEFCSASNVENVLKQSNLVREGANDQNGGSSTEGATDQNVLAHEGADRSERGIEYRSCEMEHRRCGEMVARGECVAKWSTLPLDQPAKQGSPERAADTRPTRFLSALQA